MDSYGAQIESNLFEGENKFSCPFMDIIFCYDSIGFFLVWVWVRADLFYFLDTLL